MLPLLCPRTDLSYTFDIEYPAGMKSAVDSARKSPVNKSGWIGSKRAFEQWGCDFAELPAISDYLEDSSVRKGGKILTNVSWGFE